MRTSSFHKIHSERISIRTEGAQRRNPSGPADCDQPVAWLKSAQTWSERKVAHDELSTADALRQYARCELPDIDETVREHAETMVNEPSLGGATANEKTKIARGTPLLMAPDGLCWCLVLWAASVMLPASALAAGLPLPDPLQLTDVTELAVRNRSEIVAASARAEALAQRPAIVGALEDPMVFPAIDHYPFKMMQDESGDQRYDWSVSIEQRFPLSGVRGHRRAAARADAQRARALVGTTELDIILEAQTSFFMLHERRQMLHVLDERLRLAEQLVRSSSSRYASGLGLQADVLRAEVEVARVQAAKQSTAAQVRAAEAMLNASLGRPVQDPVPPLQHTASRENPPPLSALLEQALHGRPELMAGEAEIERAAAEVEVMRSMYKPMGIVQVGGASTMAEGPGAMLMIGVSVPIWRDRLRAGVAEAQAMQTMADADLQAMRRMVEGEAAAAREIVSAARVQALMLENEVMPRAQVAIEAALAAYSSGQGVLVSVIETARTLWEVQAEQIMVEAELGAAWARLQRALGTAEEVRR